MVSKADLEAVLSQNEMTLIQLAAHFHCETSAILECLPLVAKSLKPQRELLLLPAECRNCHFIFKERQDRHNYKKPTKCPKCKSERIMPPVYAIKEVKKKK